MSENLEKTYNPKAIEAKLYEKWCDNKYFHAEVDRSKKPNICTLTRREEDARAKSRSRS